MSEPSGLIKSLRRSQPQATPSDPDQGDWPAGGARWSTAAPRPAAWPLYTSLDTAGAGPTRRTRRPTWRSTSSGIFIRYARPHLGNHAGGRVGQILASAQHHGAPTRPPGPDPLSRSPAHFATIRGAPARGPGRVGSSTGGGAPPPLRRSRALVLQIQDLREVFGSGASLHTLDAVRSRVRVPSLRLHDRAAVAGRATTAQGVSTQSFWSSTAANTQGVSIDALRDGRVAEGIDARAVQWSVVAIVRLAPDLFTYAGRVRPPTHIQLVAMNSCPASMVVERLAPGAPRVRRRIVADSGGRFLVAAARVWPSLARARAAGRTGSLPGTPRSRRPR